MYPAGQFESMDHYYSVILHELTHWTGHSSRTGRLDTQAGLSEQSG